MYWQFFYYRPPDKFLWKRVGVGVGGMIANIWCQALDIYICRYLCIYNPLDEYMLPSTRYIYNPLDNGHIFSISIGNTKNHAATLIIPPASTKLIGGYTGITLSVCPSVCLSVCPSVDRILSALYLQQYSSDPFHICTSYQATSEGVSRVMPVSKLKNLKFWRIFKICNFDFVIFWLGIQYDSMVWVIMRRRGVSSERRRSSCSSFL